MGLPNWIRLVVLTTFLASCAKFTPEPPPPSAGHLDVVAETGPSGAIPDIVRQPPPVPEPAPLEHEDRYTVVVNEVPVKELLFALARDAQVNIDIAPDISRSGDHERGGADSAATVAARSQAGKTCVTSWRTTTCSSHRTHRISAPTGSIT